MQPLLSLSITSTLDWAITVSHQDYCNCLLLDLPPALVSNLFSNSQRDPFKTQSSFSSPLSSLQRTRFPQYEVPSPTKPNSPICFIPSSSRLTAFPPPWPPCCFWNTSRTFPSQSHALAIPFVWNIFSLDIHDLFPSPRSGFFSKFISSERPCLTKVII